MNVDVILLFNSMAEQSNTICRLWSELASQLDDSTVCNPGASSAQILSLERLIGREIPPSFKTLLELCNGLGKDGFKYLSPTPMGTEQIYRITESRSKLKIKSNRPDIFDSNSAESQAFGTWPKALLEISSCDDMGHAIELESGKIFFYDYIEGGHVKLQFGTLEELLENTLELFRNGQKGLYGGMLAANS